MNQQKPLRLLPLRRATVRSLLTTELVGARGGDDGGATGAQHSIFNQCGSGEAACTVVTKQINGTCLLSEPECAHSRRC